MSAGNTGPSPDQPAQPGGSNSPSPYAPPSPYAAPAPSPFWPSPHGAPPAAGPHGPGPDEGGGRIPAHQIAPYAVSAVLLMVFAGGVIGWIVDGLRNSDSGVGDLLQALVDPLHARDAQLLTPYEWAFALALLTVAVLALCQRRVARGGALLLAFLLLGICLRQAVGSIDSDYRKDFEHPDYGAWMLATYGIGLAIAVTVLILMLQAREQSGRTPRTLTPPPYRLAGVLLVAIGVVQAAWVVDRQWQMDDGNVQPFHDYLRELVDPSVYYSPLSLNSGFAFYEAALIVSLVVVGVLALLGRRVARGAGLTLLAVAAYLQARVVTLRFQLGNWDAYFDSVRGILDVVTIVFISVTILLAAVALVGAGRLHRDVRSDW
ncbi:hypothetical protein [Streptomyces sp. B6B3]|uniref:hypothetical protein n=1 Tax=Streptomyces sp. B6B3 TaxID=3153570 RepID=UPI00325F0BB6